MMDEEACYRAVRSRDPRFDGWFLTAVVTTGIYCRPSCPAVTPKRVNVRFYATAAAAQEAGFRACKRCRPDVTPGSPEWNVRADLVGRAMRLIADGIVDRDGVGGLARALGYSDRHIHRQLVAEVGAGPIALARAQRAQTARLLLETTALPVSDVAFGAGFSSIRQFNDTIRAVFALTPTGLRACTHGRNSATAPGTVSVRLPLRLPFQSAHIFGFLAARAVPGVEEGSAHHYRRTLRLPHAPGVVDVRPDAAHDGWVRCALRLDDVRDLASAVQRTRRLLDLDADPAAVTEAFVGDTVIGDASARLPGLRVPGHVDGEEVAVRAILGQQVSVSGARTLARALVERLGEPIATPDGTLTHLFPSSATIAGAREEDLGLTRARRGALRGLARALASEDVALDPGADRDEVSARLLALPGIGPWTVAYIRMRALGDPDAFMPSDLGIKHALQRLGQPADPRSAADLAQRWRPWRSYALQYLWSESSQPKEKP